MVATTIREDEDEMTSFRRPVLAGVLAEEKQLIQNQSINHKRSPRKSLTTLAPTSRNRAICKIGNGRTAGNDGGTITERAKVENVRAAAPVEEKDCDRGAERVQ